MTLRGSERWHAMFVPALCSLLLHAAIAALMLLSSSTPTRVPSPAPVDEDKIVKATAVNTRIVEQELERLQQLEVEKKQKEDKRQKELENKAAQRKNVRHKRKRNVKKKNAN